MLTNQLDISGLINQQIQQTINEYIKTVDLASIIDQAIGVAVDSAVTKITTGALQKLIKERDLTAEIGQIITEQAANHLDSQTKLAVKNAVTQLDLKSLVSETVERNLQINIDHFDFPASSVPAKSINWDNFTASGNLIDGGIIKNFNSTGIQDLSSNCKLTVLDDYIIVENKLIAESIKTNHAEIDNLRINNIKIDGKLEAGPEIINLLSKVSRSVFSEITENKPVDIGAQAIISNGAVLLDSTKLGAGVTVSNLRKLGLLQDLRVQGDVKFSETLFVSAQGKIGVNTDEPNGVLTLWDEDAELTIKKFSKKNMFIGTTRNTDLSIGINNRDQIRVTDNEIAFNQSIRLQGIKISIQKDIPTHMGEPNEIVLVTSAQTGQPLLYICKGQNSWASLGVNVP